MTIGNANITITSRADTSGVRSMERALIRLRALSEAIEDRSSRNTSILTRRMDTLRRVTRMAMGAFGAFTNLLAKGFVVALAASSAALLAIKASLVIGRLAIKGYHMALAGLAATAATAAAALSTLAAAQREYAAASMSYRYRQQNMGFSAQMVSGAALRSFTSNAKLALSGQEALVGAFTSISRSTPVTGQLVRATEALGDFVATTGDMANIAGAGEFLGALVKAGSLTDEVVSSADKLGPAFQDAMKILKDEGKTSAAAVLDELTSGALAVKAGVDGMLTTLNNTLMGTFKRNFQMLRDQFADLGEFFLAPASESVDRIGQTLRFTIIRAGYSVGRFGQGSLFSSLESGVAKLADFFIDLLDKYLPKTEGFFGRLKEIFNAIRDAVESAWNYMERLERGGEILWRFLTTAFGGIFSGFGDGLTGLQSLLKENREPLMEFGQSLRDLFAGIAELFGEMRKALFAALPVLRRMTDLLTSLVGAITGVFGFISGNGEGAGGINALGALAGMFMLRRLGGGRGRRAGGAGAGGGAGGGGMGGFFGRVNERGAGQLGVERDPNTGRMRYIEGRTVVNAAGQRGEYQNGTWGYRNSSGTFIPYNRTPTPRDYLSRGGFREDDYRQAREPAVPGRGRIFGAGARETLMANAGYAAPGAAMIGSLLLGQIDSAAAGNAANALSMLAMLGFLGGARTMGIGVPFIAGQYAESMGLRGATGLGAVGSLGAGIGYAGARLGVLRGTTGVAGGVAAAGAAGAYASGRYLAPALGELTGMDRGGQKAVGIVGGMATGAAAGAIVGNVPGAVVGAIAGAIIGALGSSQAFKARDADLRKMADNIANQFKGSIITAIESQDPTEYMTQRVKMISKLRDKMNRESNNIDETITFAGRIVELNEAYKGTDKLARMQINNEVRLAAATGLATEEIRKLAQELGVNLQTKLKNVGAMIAQLLEIPVFKNFKEFSKITVDALVAATRSVTQAIINERETRVAVNQEMINLRSKAVSGVVERADVATSIEAMTAYEVAKAGIEGRSALSGIANMISRAKFGTGALFTGEETPEGFKKGLFSDIQDQLGAAGYAETFDTVVTRALQEIGKSSIGTLITNNPNLVPATQSLLSSAAERAAALGATAEGAAFQERLSAVAMYGQSAKASAGYSTFQGPDGAITTGAAQTYGQIADAADAFIYGLDPMEIAMDDLGLKIENIAGASDPLVTAIQGQTNAFNTSATALGIFDNSLKRTSQTLAEMYKELMDAKEGGWLRKSDTATQRFGRTLSAHNALNNGIAGKRTITSGIRNTGLGSPSSDHLNGNAYDLVGQNLQAYANATKMNGGFAEFHGAAGTRHLHVVPGMGPLGAAMGDSSTPAMAGAMAKADYSTHNYNITVNPSANASAAEIADEVIVRIERTQRSTRERS